MGKYDTGRASDFGGINIEQRREDSLNGIRFDASRDAPTSSNDLILYRNGTGLYFWNGTSAILLGEEAGGASVPTLDSIFGIDKTLNVAGTTLTIDNSTGNNDVLTLTNTGAGSGAVLKIDNVGTGADIEGSSDTWSISKAGAASLDSLTIAGTAGSTVSTITAGDAALSDGSLAITDADNAASFTVTNDTATTASVIVLAGSGAFTGSTTGSFMTITPSGLTSGTAVYLPVAALTTGKALHVVGNAVTSGILLHVSSSAAGTQLTGNGRLMLLEHSGNASGTGTVAEMSTAATDETVLLKLTATGALALGTILSLSGSSVTTGTAIGAIDLDGLTTGIGLSLASTATALTTGSMLRISTGTTGAVATNGVVSIVATAAYTSTSNCGLLQVVADSVTTGATILNVSGTAATTSVLARFVSSGTGLTSGSVILATTGTTGAIATNGAFSFTGTGDFTVGAVGLGLFHVAGNSTTAGTVASVSGTALTTGVALHIASTGTGMTSGSLLRLTTGTTGAVATNGVVSIRATGAYTSTSNAGLLDVASASLVGAGTLVNLKLSSASQTAAVALNIEQSGTTTGYTGNFVRIVGTSTTGASNLIGITAGNTTAGNALSITNDAITLGAATLVNLVHGTSVLGAGSSMLRITSTGVDTGTTTGVLVDLAATAATSATLMLVTSATLDSGKALVMNLNGLTTGAGISIAHTTSVIESGGSLMRLSSTGIDTATTTGVVLDLVSSGSTSGTQVLATFAALTDGKGFRMVANALTTGIMLDLESSDAGFAGNYIRCYDGAAVDFSVGEDGAVIIGGNAIGTAALTLNAGDATLTSGNLILAAGHIKNTPQAIVNANTAISVVTLSTTIANNASSTHTLADGTVGQLKVIVCTVYTGDAVITPANFVGTTITLNAAGDSWLGQFVGTEWVTLALGGTAAVA